jgi:hypothetical protein
MFFDRSFPEGVFLVGSCLDRADYRDVDVRVMLPDKEFSNMFPSADPKKPHWDPRWELICTSISYRLAQITLLPIDFQIQQMTAANAEHKGKRSALGFMSNIKEIERDRA